MEVFRLDRLLSTFSVSWRGRPHVLHRLVLLGLFWAVMYATLCVHEVFDHSTGHRGLHWSTRVWVTIFLDLIFPVVMMEGVSG